jgi:iron complex outermembrane receptor protein
MPVRNRLSLCSILLGVLASVAVTTSAAGGTTVLANDADALDTLSLEALMDIEITSASKRAQKASEVPGAMFVITPEMIRRSGFRTIPEVLRLVPGLHVAHVNANQWAITSRGLNNQYANKLLVLIDGRSVYTPLFAGVYWDAQDTVLEDIARIEVIRGPGGAVWGANAVNGVINIITKSAFDTQGLLHTSIVGEHTDYSGAARYGFKVGEDFAARGYVKGYDRDDFDSPFSDVKNGEDDWRGVQGGARLDWNVTDDDLVTFSGDWLEGNLGEDFIGGLGADTVDTTQANTVLRWTHQIAEGNDVTVQGYWDHIYRTGTISDELRDTWDVEARHNFQPFEWMNTIWGGGYRVSRDTIANPAPLSFSPNENTDQLASLFIQNEFTLVPDKLKLVMGSKGEHNDYTGFEFQPTARILAMPHEDHTLWASFSRAVRTPSRIEDDLSVIYLDNPTAPSIVANVARNRSFRSEVVLAYEAGYRATPFENFTFDLAGYYNDYSKLRSLNLTNETVNGCGAGCNTYDGKFQNSLDGVGYGVELAMSYKPFDWWLLQGSYTWMEIKLDLDSDGTFIDPLSESQERDTPNHQFQIHSELDLPWGFEFDQHLYYVGPVRNQIVYTGLSTTAPPDQKKVGDYFRFDLRLGWRHPDWGLGLEVVGQNITDGSHAEYGSPLYTQANLVPRTVYGKVTWEFF